MSSYVGDFDSSVVDDVKTQFDKSHEFVDLPSVLCPLKEPIGPPEFSGHFNQLPANGFSKDCTEPGTADSFNQFPACHPTTFLILEDRPCDLPAKDIEEKKQHVKQYDKLLKSVKKRYSQMQKDTLLVQQSVRKRDSRSHELLCLWRSEIIPRWEKLRSTKRVKRLIWEGIPSVVRRDVWSLLMGDSLNIDRVLFEQCLELSHERLRASNNRITSQVTSLAQASEKEQPSTNCSMCSMVFNNLNATPLQHELSLGYNEGPVPCATTDVHSESTNFNCLSPRNSCTPPFYQLDRAISLRSIRLDVSRTFPSVGLFQPGNPYHDPLHDLLAAYVAYKPEIGYVQGMSFLAAIVLLVMHDTFDAFVMFANILERPCHRAFYSLDENEFVVYFRAFDQILARHLPRLHAHFRRVGLEPNMYLFDWFFTIFSRSLPLEADMRVWDLFFLDGELALFRAALGILQLYESRLIQSSFDQLALFLTGALPSELSADCLVNQMRFTRLKKKEMLRQVARVRADLAHDLYDQPSDTHSRPKEFFVRCATLADFHGTYYSVSSPEPAQPPCFIFNPQCVLSSPSTVPSGPVDHSVVSLCSSSGSQLSFHSLEDVDDSNISSVYSPDVHHSGTVCLSLANGFHTHSHHDSVQSPSRRKPPPLCPKLLSRSPSFNSASQHTPSPPHEPSQRIADQRLRACIQRVIERVP